MTSNYRPEIELQTTKLLNSKFSNLDDVTNAQEELKKLVDTSKAVLELHQLELTKAKKIKPLYIRDTILTIHNSLNIAREQSISSQAIADELKVLTPELVSSYSEDRQPTILDDLERFHRNLKELASVRDYLLVIANVLRLSESSISQIKAWSSSSTEISILDSSCLTDYRALQSFVGSVFQNVSGQFVGAPAPLGLVSFTFKVRDQTWTSIREILSSQLLQVLESIGWPNAIDFGAVSKQTQFETAFMNLLRLQVIGEDLHKEDAAWISTGVYPIQTLVVPISLRFKYHFASNRDTNRIDKPEWFFTHIANEIHKHRPFFETHVARLLSRTKYKQINAYKEFILSLMPLLSQKLRRTIPSILSHPALLAHTIYACLAFDVTLHETGFSLEGTSAAINKSVSDTNATVWEGLTAEIIGNKDWFQYWLEGERQFANNQYVEIISDPDARQLGDNDNMFIDDTLHELKATNSSRRLVALVEQITERYRALPGFYFRTQFLIHVQLPILEMYHSHISASADTFELLSTSLVRAVPEALAHQIGHNTESRNSIAGVDNLNKLVCALISASHVSSKLDKWNDDQFFLELWSEINARVALRDRPSVTSRGCDQDVFATSRGTIFQELVDQYHKLVQRTESMIVSHVCSEIELAGKMYFSSQPSSPGELSNSLALPLLVLSTHLKLLVSSLPTGTFIPLYRRIVSHLWDVFYERRILVLGGPSSFAAAAQMSEECLMWVQSCRMALEPAVKHVEGPWKRLEDAVKVLTLSESDFQAMALRMGRATPDEVESIQDDLDINALDLKSLQNIVKIRQNFL